MGFGNGRFGRFSFLLLFVGILTTVFPGTAAAQKSKTTMQNGVWVSNLSCELIQGEINEKSELICLPKIEFIGNVEKEELKKRLAAGIPRQDAVFHLYHDGLGKPTRMGKMLFASDIYLKEAKMTYVGILRSWGYKFKISKVPAFSDPDYIRDVQSGAFISGSSSAGAAGTNGSSGSGGSGTGEGKTTGKAPQGGQQGAGGSVSTSYDSLPAGVLHPSIRKMKKELDAKIKEIKGRPFQAEVIRVDPVRWATGRMGFLESTGIIRNSFIEGKTLDAVITPPAKSGWFTPELAAELASQPTEFILQRDLNGREIRKDNALVLADVYLVDLGLTWNDWLESKGLTPASATALPPHFASGPVTLGKKVVQGVFKEMKAPVLALVGFEGGTDGLPNEELIRVPPPETAVGNVRSFLDKINPGLAGKKVSVSFLACPDGSWYEELGQKRAARVYFPDTSKTLGMVFREVLSNRK